MSKTSTVALLALVAALAFAAGAGFAADPPAQPHQHDEAFLKCADACNSCQRECDACGTHCAELIAQGKKEHVKTLQTCRDCGELCAAAARVTAAKGPFADLACTACAEACVRCGKACEQFADDPMMKRCADECKKCEAACREMIKHAAAGAPPK